MVFLPTCESSKRTQQFCWQKWCPWAFSSHLVVRIWGFHCCGPGSIPGLGTEMPYQAFPCCGKKTQIKPTTTTTKKHGRFISGWGSENVALVEKSGKFSWK